MEDWFIWKTDLCRRRWISDVLGSVGTEPIPASRSSGCYVVLTTCPQVLLKGRSDTLRGGKTLLVDDSGTNWGDRFPNRADSNQAK